MTARRFHSSRGQSLLEFTIVVPLVLLLVLGVVEASYALLDQHIVIKITREAANLISRDTSLEDAAQAMRTMSTRPVDFDNGSRLILSVLKRGGTTGTSNYDKLILYQRYEYGTLAASSTLQMAGGGSFGGPPNYQAANSDDNTGLQVTNLPSNLGSVPGALVYVAEVFTTHELITPFDRLGVQVPTTLQSIAYF